MSITGFTKFGNLWQRRPSTWSRQGHCPVSSSHWPFKDPEDGEDDHVVEVVVNHGEAKWNEQYKTEDDYDDRSSSKMKKDNDDDGKPVMSQLHCLHPSRPKPQWWGAQASQRWPAVQILVVKLVDEGKAHRQHQDDNDRRRSLSRTRCSNCRSGRSCKGRNLPRCGFCIDFDVSNVDYDWK